MAEKYYQFLSDLTESCGAYRVASAADTPDAAYHSRVGVPTPHANDFLIISDSGALQMYRPSDPDVFSGIEFEHFPALEQLLANGTLYELMPDECQNFLSLRTSIEQVTNRLSAIQAQMLDGQDTQLFIDLKQQEIDLQAALHRLQLSLQIPQTAFDTHRMNAALIQSMQDAGFRQVSPPVMSTRLRFENPRTGQIHAFDNAQQAQSFLENRSVAATLYYRHSNNFTEEITYYSGEETAALDAYREGLDALGEESLDYKVEPDAAYDHLGYQFLCAYTEHFGHAPNKSEVEYISNREMQRMGQPIPEVGNTLTLDAAEIAAIAYTEPDGERIELHFSQNEQDTAVFAFQNIMEQNLVQEVVVADTAPDLDYALYQKYCDATETTSRLDEEQFMARFHHNAAGERTIHQGADDPLIGESVGFERIRRITGYLVGDLDRFNNAKRAEVRDRLPHVAGHAPASPHLGSQKTIDGPEL